MHVYAFEKDYSEIPTTGKAAIDLKNGKMDINESLFFTTPGIKAAGKILKVNNGIYQVSKGLISGYGETTATAIVEEIGYYIEFQEWNGYDWIGVEVRSNIKSNDISVYNWHNKSVQAEKYYRVKVSHFVKEIAVFL